MQDQPAPKKSFLSQDSEFAQKQPIAIPDPSSSGAGDSPVSPGEAETIAQAELTIDLPAPPDQLASLETPTAVEPIQKEKTVSKSIRLWQSAFDALKVLMGKYGRNMVDMASIAILAYAKEAAAAPILRFRIMTEITLFALQASATDIRTGLSNFRNDLYKSRKSHRDPVELKLLYAKLSAKYQKVLDHAEETLQKMDKELLLYKLLDPSDHALLVQLLDRLEQAKPKNRSERQIRDLHLKIYRSLIP